MLVCLDLHYFLSVCFLLLRCLTDVCVCVYFSVDSDEVKKLSTALNALYNDKVKSKQTKSKKGKKGASLKVEVSDSWWF